MSAMENIQNTNALNRPLQRAIDESPRFKPALPLLGGHVQTILGHFLPAPPLSEEFRKSRKVKLLLPDGDELWGREYAANGNQNPTAVVHIFHGLAGSSDSKYMPRAAAACAELGLSAITWNHRGCGDGRHRAIGTYHSGRSDDLARAVQWGRQNFPDRPQIVIGYSLSGNAAILLSAGIVPAHSNAQLSRLEIQNQFQGDLPDFAIAVSPPFDLYLSALRLSHKGSRLYGQRFMFDLIECLNDREAISADNLFPQSASENRFSYLQEIAKSAGRQIRPWDSVIKFDRVYTGPAGGFADHMDYYRRASSGQVLGQQLLPLVILTADDDPITNGLGDVANLQLNTDQLTFVIDRQTHGGHMGFVDRELLKQPTAIALRWMERRLQLYLAEYLKMYLAKK